MDLRLLRYFLAIVTTGSVTAASKELFVAQPSLSRQLRRLEDELGFALFDRSERRLVLTAAGQTFLPVAADLVNRAAQASAMARVISQGTTEHLVVSAAPTTINDIIAPYIVTGSDSFSVANVVERSPAEVYDAVRSGDADLAIGTRLPPADLEHQVVGRVPLWAECPPGHPLAEHDTVSLEALVEWPLIVMQDSHAVRRLFDDAVVQAGHTYETALETKSSTVAQALAATGKGVCVTSDDARFGLRELPIRAGDVKLTLTIYAAWDGTHYAVEQIERGALALADFIGERYGVPLTAV